jgi:hypothetical protein
MIPGLHTKTDSLIRIPNFHFLPREAIISPAQVSQLATEVSDDGEQQRNQRQRAAFRRFPV